MPKPDGKGDWNALGDRFDLGRFHNALIDDGALPLDVLERRIDAWIARERAAGAS
ncbi:MAG: hypothetical protein M3R40_03345 [Pseudomonadota bacterium]|nr:hypothetical protein [Pseudomonadota bacterium]